jgi:MarR family transcriptional regulator, temperature-dependent positive regulator of motility
MPMKRASAGDLDRSPLHLLHRASQSVIDVYQAKMKADGLTPRQLALLMAISENEGLNQRRIVDRTGSDRSTVAEVIRRLQHKGLIQRRRTKEDARAYAIKLTDEGHRLLRAVQPLANSVDKRVLNAVTAERRDQFLGSLRAIVDALEGMGSKVQSR